MTVGILGAGQLGRMLALAGYPLGLDFLFLDPAKDAPAASSGRQPSYSAGRNRSRRPLLRSFRSRISVFVDKP